MKSLLFFIFSITLLFSDSFISTKLAIQQGKLEKVDKESAIIDIANLKVGQSGVIIKEFDSGESIIIALATVSQSNNKNSKLKIIYKELLKQDSIPTSKIKVKSGDFVQTTSISPP